jgi:YbbR domain-containing protein
MRFVASNIRTFLLALVLGIAVWVSAVSAANPNEVSAYPKSIPIEIIGQDSSLVLTSKKPENVDVTIRAPHSVWQLLKTQDNAVRAILDLSGLSAGEHEVAVKIQISLRPTQIVLANPTSVTVDLEPIATQTLTVNHSLS